MDPTELNPDTRKLLFLGAIAGMDVELPPPPYSREEQFYRLIIQSGGGGGSGGGTTHITSITIPVAAWKRREDAEAVGGVSFYADVAIQGLKESDVTNTYFSPESMEIARQNGMLSATSSMNGAIRYYAVSIPSEDLTAQVTITKNVSGSGPGYGGVNTTGDIGVIANLNRGMRLVCISMFESTLQNYGLSLSEYGKIRAAMYYKWTAEPDLSAEEIAEIFNGENPSEMSDVAIEAAVLDYAHLTFENWCGKYGSITNADANYNITEKYLPDRASIQAWIDENTSEQEETP